MLLEIVIHAFRRGDSPDDTVHSYTSLSLQDVYAVVAYYLRHQAEVDAYVAERDRIGDENGRFGRLQQGDLRALLLARQEQRRKN